LAPRFPVRIRVSSGSEQTFLRFEFHQQETTNETLLQAKQTKKRGSKQPTWLFEIVLKWLPRAKLGLKMASLCTMLIFTGFSRKEY
jgi:hypothetical protein